MKTLRELCHRLLGAFHDIQHCASKQIARLVQHVLFGYSHRSLHHWQACNSSQKNTFKISHNTRYKVNYGIVNSKQYRANIRKIFGSKAASSAFTVIQNMLRHRGNSNGEDLYAIDLNTGQVISSVVTSNIASTVKPNKKFLKKIDRAIASGSKIVTLHNHPASTHPSLSDLQAIKTNGSKFGVIACHDGSFYTYRIVSGGQVGYNINNAKGYERVNSLWLQKGESSLFKAIEERYGVKIEHIT